MRTIKFRAWHGKLKRMIDLEGAVLTSIGFEWTDENGKSWECESDTVMQFTGLKDKNGVEIYDGDLLNIKWSMMGEYEGAEWQTENHIAGVEWRNNGWFVRWAFFSKPLCLDGNKEICWYENYKRSNSNGSFNKITELEVIGNIHENPNLLAAQSGGKEE